MSFKVGDLVRTKPMKVTTISDIDRESPGRSENIFYQLENTSIHRADDIEPLPTQPNEGMREALEEEQRKFRQETLRTSELSVLLKKWQDRAEYHSHQRSPWAIQCDWCELTRETHELLNKPINAPLAAGGK